MTHYTSRQGTRREDGEGKAGGKEYRQLHRFGKADRCFCKRKRIGFHAFRRFRLTRVRKNGVPRDLERFWMGHAETEVGDLYSKLKDDVSFRQEWAERIGLGFELVHVGTQNAGGIKVVRVA